nr:hypothetical protein [uncultured Mediterranean phage uvMED]
MSTLDRNTLPRVVAPIVVCREEGGHYILDSDKSAPIRIYSNGIVEDDIYYSKSTEFSRVREVLTNARLLWAIIVAYSNLEKELRSQRDKVEKVIRRMLINKM